MLSVEGPPRTSYTAARGGDLLSSGAVGSGGGGAAAQNSSAVVNVRAAGGSSFRVVLNVSAAEQARARAASRWPCGRRSRRQMHRGAWTRLARPALKRRAEARGRGGLAWRAALQSGSQAAGMRTRAAAPRAGLCAAPRGAGRRAVPAAAAPGAPGAAQREPGAGAARGRQRRGRHRPGVCLRAARGRRGRARVSRSGRGAAAAAADDARGVRSCGGRSADLRQQWAAHRRGRAAGHPQGHQLVRGAARVGACRHVCAPIP